VALGSQPSDAELVSRATSGDEAAFADLVRRHERKVYNLAFRMLGREEDARDAAQDTFVSCYRRLSGFRGEAQFSTWLHRIAVNACYDVLRRRRGTVLPLEDAPEPTPQADHADAAAAAVDVQRALQDIAFDYRAVLVLYDIQGWAYEEVAGILDVPLGTVKSRLHRGRIALAQALGAPDDASPPNDESERGEGDPHASVPAEPEPNPSAPPSNPALP
jgi:RNA polymerase sigma-70 factor (ECF subfamily)